MRHDLPERIASRLEHPMPGHDVRRRFEPELSFGRHFDPPAPDARRAAVLILLYPGDDDWLIPLTLRPESIRTHAGQISLPGGAIDPGETSQQAALRELDEELGIAPTEVEILGQLSPLYLFVSNFSVAPWVAASRRRLHPRANPSEVAAVLEAPLTDLLNPANIGRHTHQRGDIKVLAPHIAHGQHRIWGAACMILAEFLAVVRDVEG